MAEKPRKRRKPPQPKGGGEKSCLVEGCKRSYRAKGFCYLHYRRWRRGEIEGRARRYGTCHKENCHEKVVARGLCQEHLDAWKATRKSAALAAPPAAPAAEAPAAG